MGGPGSGSWQTPQLTPEECKQIKRLSVGFIPHSTIAKRFNVSEATVRRVVRREGAYGNGYY